MPTTHKHKWRIADASVFTFHRCDECGAMAWLPKRTKARGVEIVDAPIAAHFSAEI